mgnify:CR=1 FL=1
MDGFAELIERKRQGSLKVYLGYAAGVGKTYAMLQEGLRLKQQHVDVVIGYLEPHDRPETMALSEASGSRTSPRMACGGRRIPRNGRRGHPCP